MINGGWNMLEELNGFLDKKEGLDISESSDPQNQDEEIKSKIATSCNSEVTGVASSQRDMRVCDFFQRVERCGINLNELRDILAYGGTMEIVSGAGSGKTTALVLKIIFDIVSGDATKTVVIPSASGGTAVTVVPNILVTTFLKSGAEELSRSFNSWCVRLRYDIDTSKIKFKTLHAEVYSALQGLGVTMNMATDNTSTYRTIMKNLGIRNSSITSRAITLEEIRDIECIMAYVRNRLDNQKYIHPLMEDYKLTKEIVELFLKMAKAMRRASGTLDFEDMQELLIEGIKSNEAVLKYIQSRYDYIYCDEFQDTSQLQYQLLQYYFSKVKKVVVIGDDDQCIYSWRGSDIKIITEYFKEDYSPKVFNLSTNYRCSANILNAVVPSITQNKYRLEKSLKAYNEGGSLTVKMNYSVLDLISEMKEACKNGSVGVLSRTNNDLLVPALVLELDGGIDFTLSKSVGIHNKLPFTIFGIIKLLTRPYDPTFEEYFNMFVPFYSKRESSVLCEILMVNKEKSIFTIPKEDLEYSVPILWGKFIRPLREWVDSENGEITIDTYLFLLSMFEMHYEGDSVYCRRARELIGFLRDLASKKWNDSLLKLDTFITKTLPERLSSRIATSKSSATVKLTTVHEAKGKEWDTVFIWNDTYGVFPAVTEKRELTKEEFEEERRVHYIAWTRARNSLIVYTSRGRLGFVSECDIPDGCLKVEGLGNKTLVKNSTPSLSETIVQACLNNESEVLDKYSIDSSFKDLVVSLVKEVGYELAVKRIKPLFLDSSDDSTKVDNTKNGRSKDEDFSSIKDETGH